MTSEDKSLLIKDLSARLQYNVQILADIDKTFEGGVISTLKVINLKKDWVELQSVLTPFKFDEIKPYLRPMSSMTEDECNELASITFPLMEKDWEGNENPACIRCVDVPKYMNFIFSHHLDYRGLIPKGLALEAPEGMYNLKTYNYGNN